MFKWLQMAGKETSFSGLPPEFIVIALVFLFSIVVAIAGMMMARTARRQLKRKAIELAETRSQFELLSDQHAKQLEELKEKGNDQMELIASRTKAITERDEALKQRESMLQQRELAKAAQKEAEAFADSAERESAITKIQMEEMRQRITDWEKQREEMVKSAHSSILEVGQKMSSKLLDDHKREAEEVKKQQEEQVRKTTEKLMTQFQEITQSVARIRHQSVDTKQQMDTVMQALTNPTGAGKMAEVGLENLLKNFGLQLGVDFFMQYSAVDSESGKMLRPDAVIKLPQNMLVVVDSKASKHLIELARHDMEDDDVAKQEITLQALKKTMNEHLRALSSKNYKDAVARHLKEVQGGGAVQIGHMFNVMYVPSEQAIERIHQADPEFNEKLAKDSIHLVGPSGLFAIFQLAREQIAADRRNENNEQIVEMVERLMESLATAFAHVDKVGTGIKSSMENFEKFARSVNRNLIPRMHHLNKLGVSPAKGKKLPAPIATYDIRRIADTLTLEADADAAEEGKTRSDIQLVESAEA